MSERQRPLVYAALKDKVDEILIDQDVIECESPSASETIPEKSQKLRILHCLFYLKMMQGKVLKNKRRQMTFYEYNLFFQMKTVCNSSKENAERFPIIAKVAKRFLCIPATSVPAERVFSTTGLIINEKRSSLLPENSDMLIFLNKNLPPIN